MQDDFRSYLATEIVSEQSTVSYRNVARALKVHVNAAKCMLYEFYEYENMRRAGSVYATYLIAGTKKNEHNAPRNANAKHTYDDDEPMPPSSPPPFTSSMLEPSEHGSEQDPSERFEVPVKTVTLVREELLAATKARFETITSIHIYSLSLNRIQDLVTLTDISRGLFSDTFVKEDPLIHNKTYGVIQNPEVRRRKGGRPVISEAPAPKFKPVKEESKPTISSKLASQPVVKTEESKRPSSSGSTSSTNASTKQGTLKRDTSDIFKSFTKAKSKPKPTLSRNDTDVSTNASASGAEDTKMTDADEEGESEEDALFLDTGKSKQGTKKRASDVRKERDDKAAKLRKMMDSDDDEAIAVPKIEEASSLKENSSIVAHDNGDVAWSDSDAEPQSQSASIKNKSGNNDNEPPASSTEPKRRRGRRKVMKKKRAKDEDGYLVTKEEAVWESFSEDEPIPQQKTDIKSAFPSRNQQNSSQGKTSTSAAAGKSGAKGGAAKGGNIMNFFGRK